MIQMKMFHFHTQFFNPLSTLLNQRNPPKFFISCQLWGEFPEAAKQMIIEYNKKIKVANQDNTSMVATPNQNLLWDNLTSDNSSPEASTQAMLHECLSDGIHLILAMSCQLSRPRLETHLKIYQEKSNTYPKICFC